MRMLRWMCGHTIKDRIHNEHIPLQENMSIFAAKFSRKREPPKHEVY